MMLSAMPIVALLVVAVIKAVSLPSNLTLFKFNAVEVSSSAKPSLLFKFMVDLLSPAVVPEIVRLSFNVPNFSFTVNTALASLVVNDLSGSPVI